jgi:hypothetical protein
MAINDIAGSLPKKFAAYKEQLEAASAELKAVQRKIKDTLAAKRDLSFQQCTRDEFVAALSALVDNHAAEGAGRRAAMLDAWSWPANSPKPLVHFSAQMLTWPYVQAVAGGDSHFGAVALPFLFGGKANDVDNKGVLVDAQAICLVLGESIKANLKSYMAGVEWPEEQPAAQRVQQLAQLDAELGNLRKVESDLIALIGDNSISPIQDL